MSIQISSLDKRIIEHLEKGGNLEDEVGSLLLTQMIELGLKKSEISKHIEQGTLSRNDLSEIYKKMVYCLMPNPAIKVGARLLVASQFFMEPEKLDMLVEALKEFKDEEFDQLESNSKIEALSIEFANMSKEAHDGKFGEVEFIINDVGGITIEEYNARKRGKIGCLIILLIIGIGIFYYIQM